MNKLRQIDFCPECGKTIEERRISVEEYGEQLRNSKLNAKRSKNE